MRGGDIEPDRFKFCEDDEARSSRPQSFVTSHQNEYKELAAAANSLGGEQHQSTYKEQDVDTHHKRKSALPDAISCSSVVLWAAERKMTGKDDAYLSALYRGRRLSFVGDECSIKH